MFRFCCRFEDHHQRVAPLFQTIGGGHDADDLLSDGVRPLRPSGVQRGASQQMRPEDGRPQRLLRNVVQVSPLNQLDGKIRYK